jgi:hypothetical protein
MTELFQQCRLQNNKELLVSWIPSKFAKKGKNIRIKINGEWEHGWLVDEVFKNKITRKELDTLAWQYTHTREVSDI